MASCKIKICNAVLFCRYNRLFILSKLFHAQDVEYIILNFLKRTTFAVRNETVNKSSLVHRNEQAMKVGKYLFIHPNTQSRVVVPLKFLPNTNVSLGNYQKHLKPTLTFSSIFSSLCFPSYKKAHFNMALINFLKQYLYPLFQYLIRNYTFYIIKYVLELL